MATIHKFPPRNDRPGENLLFLFDQAVTRSAKHSVPGDPIQELCRLLEKIIILSGENPHMQAVSHSS